MAVNYWIVGSSPTWGADLEVTFNKQKFAETVFFVAQTCWFVVC